MDRKINRALAAARSGRGRLHRYPHSTSMNQRGYAGRGNEPDDIAVKSRPVDEILKVAGVRLPGAWNWAWPHIFWATILFDLRV
jgi:hypothetical protein